MTTQINRRQFINATAVSTAAFAIASPQILRGAEAPSNKLNLAYIGCGTQGLREMLDLLANPEVQIVAVCDPEKENTNYVDWSKDGLRSEIARALDNPNWRKGDPGIPGGRDVAKEIIETYYAKKRASGNFKGCASYADYRELLEKEKDIDAVKVMTPDHLHATIAVAAMKKGKHVVMHKPLANRVKEARIVIETARQTRVATHFLAASPGEQIHTVAEWIRAGAIGTMRQIHNWSNRPVWPQYAEIPTDTPPVPKTFDWDLWLGPSLDRPYHPHYTHAVFRGWYEFGGGPIADMGHYSLWPVFLEFDLDAPIIVESTPSHVCKVVNNVSVKIRNDYSFPMASTIRFQFAAKGNRPAVDLFWYDGGMKPPTPDELEGGELSAEGMMFVGDKGKILAEFLGENPRIIPQKKHEEFLASKGLPTSAQAEGRGVRGARSGSWVNAFKSGKSIYGDFLLAGPISEAFNLGAISLKLGGKRLLWDAANMKIKNLQGAEKHLVREYRQGWELIG
jgi:hypothetical protein